MSITYKITFTILSEDYIIRNESYIHLTND